MEGAVERQVIKKCKHKYENKTRMGNGDKIS